MLRPLSAILIASVGSLLAMPAAAQNTLPSYAPGTARYRVVTTINASQVAMGQTQTSDSKTEEVHTVVIAKAGTGLTQTMTFDSASFTSNPPAPTPDAAALLGLKFTATMGVDGKVSMAKITDKSGAEASAELASQMRSFLPRLKPGATVGATWTDSSTTTRRQNAADVTNTIASNFTLVGDTTVAGARAWKINVASTGKLSGAGNQGGADYTISGTVNGHGIIVVSTGGVLIGAELTSDVNLVAEVAAANMQIPITQKQNTIITKLP